MAFDLSRKIVALWKEHPEEKFTSWEIAERIFATYPEDYREKQSKPKATATPLDSDAALVVQIAGEIGARRILNSIW